MIKSFPKIFSIGQDYIKDLFEEEVEISEKIDGSQFDFGKINGELYMRSKGQQVFVETVDKMFKIAVDYVLTIQDKIKDNTIYYCEYLKSPKHNMLPYERVPKNNLILFGVSDITATKFISNYDELKKYADDIDIETVPLLYKGKIENTEEIKNLLKNTSVLGKSIIEGIVAKNYHRQFLLGGQPMPLMMGKYVREDFKEVLHGKWGKEHTSRGRWQTFCEGFRTESRWNKAVQHLKENGILENSPRDIGKLIKEVKNDIDQEEKENIKNFLYQEFGQEVFRKAVSGMPEWYKDNLMKRSLSDNKD